MNPGCNWPSRQSWEFHGSAVIPTVIDNHALSVRLSEQVPNALETSYICLRNNVNLCSKNDILQLPNFWKLTNPAPTISNPLSFLQNHSFLLVMMAHISLQIPTALEPLNFWVFYGELFNRQWQATFSQSYRPAWARRIQHIFFWLRILTLAGVAHLNVVWNLQKQKIPRYCFKRDSQN